MKKSVVFSLATLVAAMLCAQSAVAALKCDAEAKVQLSPGQTFTNFFFPLKSGNHRIYYRNTITVGGAYIDLFLRNNANGTAWSPVVTDSVTSVQKSKLLYATSSDIAFKFVFRNDAGNTTQYFYWTLCIDQ